MKRHTLLCQLLLVCVLVGCHSEDFQNKQPIEYEDFGSETWRILYREMRYSKHSPQAKMQVMTDNRDDLIWALNRMKNPDVEKDTFSIPNDFNLDECIDRELGIFITREKKKVSIRFSPETANIIKERTWHRDQELTELEDGGLRLSFTTNQLEETLFWVFSWMSNAVIEEPPELVEWAKNEIHTMETLYS